MKVRSGKGDSGGPVFRSNGQDNYTLVSIASQQTRDRLILDCPKV